MSVRKTHACGAVYACEPIRIMVLDFVVRQFNVTLGFKRNDFICFPLFISLLSWISRFRARTFRRCFFVSWFIFNFNRLFVISGAGFHFSFRTDGFACIIVIGKTANLAGFLRTVAFKVRALFGCLTTVSDAEYLLYSAKGYHMHINSAVDLKLTTSRLNKFYANSLYRLDGICDDSRFNSIVYLHIAIDLIVIIY